MSQALSMVHGRADTGAVPINDGELKAAFAQFSELSAQLTESYHLLENRVAHLTEELGVMSAERIAALEAKEKLANRLENLLNFLPGGVIVLDSFGRVTETNPVAQEMLCIDSAKESLVGQFWRDVISRYFSPRHDDGHEVSTHSGRRISLATRSLGQEGQIILLTDQTETRRLQAQLSRYERLSSMGKMVSALAHQVRTPLSAAMLYAGHLANEDIRPDQRRNFVGKLMSRLRHMEQQVRDMLLFVKGELSLNERLTLNELQSALAEAVEPVLESQSATCRWHNDVPELAIRCSQDVLISAIMNLVNNAIQAVNGRAELTIRFYLSDDTSTGEKVCIAIEDNGPGIAPEALAEVQEAFVTTKATGIGLGLAVVHTVAKGHGGHFELRSGAGGGACAIVHLPLASR